MRYNFIFFLIFSSNAYVDVYKWEENGRVHYSDRKDNRESVKKLDLPEISNYKSPNLPPIVLPESQSKKAELRYDLMIVSPVKNQTFKDNTGVIEIEFTVKPSIAAHAGHKIEYQIDNQKNYTINLKNTVMNVARGTHQLNAKVVDEAGKVLSSTVSIPVHVRRDSVHIKKNLKKSGILAPQSK